MSADRDSSSRDRRRRGDVQGLRGVAVLLVIAFHAFGWPHGGYVGVDVFFVISGFVITRGLLREAKTNGSISLVRFYERRLRRIAPAALVTLTAVSIAAFLLPAARATQVRTDAVWALFGAGNWRQILLDLHPSTTGGLSPVGHYWSLAVEEQFYLAWPLLLLLAMLAGRRVGGFDRCAAAIAILLTAGSLAFATWVQPVDVDVAYFSTLSRAWELGLGALVALASEKLLLVAWRGRALLSSAGLCSITFAALAFVAAGPGFHPVLGALLASMGAAAIILGGTREGSFVSRALEARPLEYVGELSYSLYLWHFPVIVFILTLAPSTGAAGAGLALLISAGLAWLSYRFVEQPVRHRFRWPLQVPISPRVPRGEEDGGRAPWIRRPASTER